MHMVSKLPFSFSLFDFCLRIDFCPAKYSRFYSTVLLENTFLLLRNMEWIFGCCTYFFKISILCYLLVTVWMIHGQHFIITSTFYFKDVALNVSWSVDIPFKIHCAWRLRWYGKPPWCNVVFIKINNKIILNSIKSLFPVIVAA